MALLCRAWHGRMGLQLRRRRRRRRNDNDGGDESEELVQLEKHQQQQKQRKEGRSALSTLHRGATEECFRLSARLTIQ